MIRPYNPKDLKAILELLKLNTPEYFHPSEEKDLIDYLNKKRDAYFVVEDENRIVGCGGYNLGFNNGKAARISWDMIHPDTQGCGIGSLLTNYRIEQLKRKPGIERIIVRTSQLAYQFYAKFEFRLDNIVEDYWSHGYHLYEMSIDINE